MNRTASPNRQPRVIATLDLTNADQLRLYGLVQRFHSGRWPLFRALAMRQINGALVESVEWCRMAQPSYSVVEFHRDGHGLSWRDYPTKQEAIAALRSR